MTCLERVSCWVCGHLWDRIPEAPPEYLPNGRRKLRPKPRDKRCVRCGLTECSSIEIASPGFGCPRCLAYIPTSIALQPGDALRRVVECGRALGGRYWRDEVVERPWRHAHGVGQIWMRQGAEGTEPGWWQTCDPEEDEAVPFWQVWT